MSSVQDPESSYVKYYNLTSSFLSIFPLVRSLQYYVKRTAPRRTSLSFYKIIKGNDKLIIINELTSFNTQEAKS